MRSVIQAEAFARFIVSGRAADSVRTIVAVADTNVAAARVRIAGIGTIVAVAWAVGCVVFPRPIAVFAVFKITHFFVSPLIFLLKFCLSCRMAVLKHTILDLSIENWEKNTNHNKKVPNHNIGHKIFD